MAGHSTPRPRPRPRPQPRTTTSTSAAAPLFLLSSPASSPVQFARSEGGYGGDKRKGEVKELVEIDLLGDSSDPEQGKTTTQGRGTVQVLSSGSSGSSSDDDDDDGEAIVVQASSSQQRITPLPRPPTSDEDDQLPDPATLGFAPTSTTWHPRPILPNRTGPPTASASTTRLPPVPVLDPFRQPTPPPPVVGRIPSGSGSAILSMLDQLPVYTNAFEKTKARTRTKKRKRAVIYDHDDDDDPNDPTSTADSSCSQVDQTLAGFRGPPRQFMINSEGGPIVELDWRNETTIWEQEMRKELALNKAKKKDKERDKERRATAGNGNAKRKAPTLSLDERETIKANKAAEKERKALEKERKALEKERKALEKARLAKAKAALVKANNLRAGDQATTVMELTIHLSGTEFDQLSDTEGEEEEGGARGMKKKKVNKGRKSERPQWMNITKLLQQRMDPQGCVVEAPEMPRRDLGCEGAIRWTRWCDRRWNMEKNIFEPLGEGNELVVEEDSRLVYISALQLSTQIANKTLLRNLQKIQERIGGHSQIILMHYGLNALYREMENAKQAAYREDTRLRLDNVPLNGPSTPRLVGIGERQPGKEVIQMELLRVQSQSRCFMIAVNSVEEAVDWIEQLTYDVSQKPYQRQKNMHIAALGTGEEKFASGSNLEDTFVKMLATLKSVTEPVAKGILGHYPTIKDLYDGWAKLPLGERKNMLVGIGRGSNVTGVATNRAIGTKLSETIYKIFTSEDPGMFL